MIDYLVSIESRNDTIGISKDLVNLLKLRGLRLTKFFSNIPANEEKLNPSFDVTAKVKDIASGNVFLVVSCGVNSDIQISVKQRTVLSFVSPVFDTIGLVAPYTVRARELLITLEA